MLYLIEILHQTTTCGKCEDCLRRCILSKFYIKPQHLRRRVLEQFCCILSKFYIKPQQQRSLGFSYLGCILSKFYIKPQQQRSLGFSYLVVSYRNSTSNHNASIPPYPVDRLYLIEILHQTTTSGLILIDKVLLTGCLPL